MLKQKHFLVFWGLVCYASLISFGSAQQNLPLIRQLIFEKTNALRLEKGLPKLVALDSLHFLAQYHSDNMVKHDFYEHIDHLGDTPIDRAKKLGVYPWRQKGRILVGIAENIAMTPWFENVLGCGDTRSPEAFATCVVEGWKNSPPHYANIIGAYVAIGIGLQFDAQARGFVTQNFR